MPYYGAHLSIAGGLHKALTSAQSQGMDACQLFTASPQSWQVQLVQESGKAVGFGKLLTKSSNQWRAKELIDGEVATFQDTWKQTSIRYLVAHDSYLINLASPDDALYRKSIEAFIVEVQRAERLGLHYLVTHPGAHVGSGEEVGLERVAEALDEVHTRCPGFKVQVLLETTAGQGTTLGHRFEHLAYLLNRVKEKDRLGVCLDTCHVFAAGYALAPRKEFLATLREFDRLVGLERILAFHLNDSLKPLGSRVDRHAHLGKGYLGLEPFRLLVNEKRFRERPMILETPKEGEGEEEMDAVNLAVLRGLLGKRLE